MSREVAGLAASRGIVLGFFGGMRAFFQGIGFVIGTPGVWGYALVPVVIAFVLTCVLGGLGVWGATALAHAIIGGDAGQVGTLGAIGTWLIEIVLGIVAILIAVLVAFSLAQPLSGFALEAISQRQARVLGIAEPPPQPGLASFGRSLRVTLTALAVTLPLIAVLTLISVIFPPAAFVTVPIKVVISAVAFAWDLLDYPLSLHGFGVRDRMTWIGQRFGAVLGFGLAGVLVLLIPGLGLLMLPMGVAGATRLAAESPLLPRAHGNASRALT